MKTATTAAEPPAAPAGGERKYYTYDELIATMPETSLPQELWDGEPVASASFRMFSQLAKNLMAAKKRKSHKI